MNKSTHLPRRNRDSDWKKVDTSKTSHYAIGAYSQSALNINNEGEK